MVLWIAAFLLFRRMGIVEADQTLAIRPVQRQRIIQAVGLLRRYRHTRYHELGPMAAARIVDEHLSIEVEEHIE